jgi:hypothetical protein
MSNVEVKMPGNQLPDSIFLVRYSSFEWSARTMADCGLRPALGKRAVNAIMKKEA